MSRNRRYTIAIVTKNAECQNWRNFLESLKLFITHKIITSAALRQFIGFMITICKTLYRLRTSRFVFSSMTFADRRVRGQVAAGAYDAKRYRRTGELSHRSAGCAPTAPCPQEYLSFTHTPADTRTMYEYIRTTLHAP